MLDLTKRSRSGKFRLVTKFKKEKNNKNKEVHSYLGAPGICPSPVSLPLAVKIQFSWSLLFFSALRLFPLVLCYIISSHIGYTSLSYSCETVPCLFSLCVGTD